jgi:hypothetical protein
VSGQFTLLVEASNAVVQLKSTHGTLIHVAQTLPDPSVDDGFYLGTHDDDSNAISINDLESGDKIYGRPTGDISVNLCVIASGVVAMGGA